MESSFSTDGPSFTVGRLGRPVGLKGFLGLYVEPEDLVYFEVGSTVNVGGGPVVVRSIRRGKKGYEVAFEGLADRNAAEHIRGSDVTVPERRALEDHEFWPDQLVGLDVEPGGGKVVDVVTAAAQDRLVIERGGRRFEIPFVDELVPDVDLDRGVVRIAEIRGLTNEE